MKAPPPTYYLVENFGKMTIHRFSNDVFPYQKAEAACSGIVELNLCQTAISMLGLEILEKVVHVRDIFFIDFPRHIKQAFPLCLDGIYSGRSRRQRRLCI